MPLKAGDDFPHGVVFGYIPYDKEKEAVTATGSPSSFNASKEFADKKAVLFAVPGAFTPTCQSGHLPTFINSLSAIKTKGVDQIVCIASNDVFVMSAWGKANGVKNDDIIFASDTDLQFSKPYGWTLGERTSRYAMIIDHGKVIYSENEDSAKNVSVSGADAVLAKL